MCMTNSKMTSFKLLVGEWIIVEMEAWDQDYVNMEVPGHFIFNKDGSGYFQFGLVQGEMDCRIETIGDGERIEFFWEGKKSRTPRTVGDGL
jgi:hypothetical protein